jgi:DNA-binding transcriptional LysR family regulator
MDLVDLELFLDVARRGSFAAVARERGVDASSVSRSIAALEAAAGAKLLRRTTRTMTLTEAGDLYLARLPHLLQSLRRLREEAASLRGQPVGTLRMTASVAFGEVCIVPLLAEFGARVPRLQLELLLSDDTLDLVGQRIDLAIRLTPASGADLRAVKLRSTRYRVVASPAYLKANGRPKKPADLEKHACLTFALPAFRTRWLFRATSSHAAGSAANHDAIEAVPLTSRFIVSNALALRAAAIAGLGPALLADWLIGPELDSGALVDVFPAHDVTATTFETGAWLVYPGNDAPPQKTRGAIDFFRERLSGALPNRSPPATTRHSKSVRPRRRRRQP